MDTIRQFPGKRILDLSSLFLGWQQISSGRFWTRYFFGTGVDLYFHKFGEQLEIKRFACLRFGMDR